MGSNSVKEQIFFRFNFRPCLSCGHKCDGLFVSKSFPRSSNIQCFMHSFSISSPSTVNYITISHRDLLPVGLEVQLVNALSTLSLYLSFYSLGLPMSPGDIHFNATLGSESASVRKTYHVFLSVARQSSDSRLQVESRFLLPILFSGPQPIWCVKFLECTWSSSNTYCHTVGHISHKLLLKDLKSGSWRLYLFLVEQHHGIPEIMDSDSVIALNFGTKKSIPEISLTLRGSF